MTTRKELERKTAELIQVLNEFEESKQEAAIYICSQAVVVFGLFGLTSAYGVCPPQWSPGPNSDCPNCSCDPVTLEQMGDFDANGNWVFDLGIQGTAKVTRTMKIQTHVVIFGINQK